MVTTIVSCGYRCEYFAPAKLVSGVEDNVKISPNCVGTPPTLRAEDRNYLLLSAAEWLGTIRCLE